jgi:hypothetical protein
LYEYLEREAEREREREREREIQIISKNGRTLEVEFGKERGK